MRAADFAYFEPGFIPYAHRGGAQYPPNLHRENTAYAFGQAVSLGYRYLETDVHATADGVLLAFHDPRLDRVTDRQGLVAELPYAEVKEALIGGREPIPTLAELFTAFPQCRFNIDAKSETAVDLLADTIEEFEAQDRVCVSSFGVRRINRLRRRLGPRVASAASMRGVAWNRFVPVLNRLLNTPAPALQIPVEHVVLGRSRRILTPALIDVVHRAGKLVHVWTIDDASVMNELIDAGVDGIFTDRIDTLKEVLLERGLWSGTSGTATPDYETDSKPA
jgi:glycerophosphoryl diester phosphodiesterase